MLKYLAVVVLVVVGYLSAWTAVSVDNVTQHGVNSSIDLVNNTIGSYTMCKAHWWDYVIEFAEFFFLCFGIYLCYCSRSAYSDYSESKYVSYAIYNETFFSVMLHVSRHFIWENVHPDYVFILYFLHCQLTVTATLVYLFAPKVSQYSYLMHKIFPIFTFSSGTLTGRLTRNIFDKEHIPPQRLEVIRFFHQKP